MLAVETQAVAVELNVKLRAGWKSETRNRISTAVLNSYNREGFSIVACGARILIIIISLRYCI